MKSSSIFKSRKREQGVALVIVLSVVVLLAVLIVGFLTSVRTEKQAVAASTGGFSARQVAESTTNLVIAQIREATTPPPGAAGEKFTWASQPGVIRNYSGSMGQKEDTGFRYTPDFATNDPVFKLYSSDSMKVRYNDYRNTAGDNLFKETEVIAGWSKYMTPLPFQNHIYTDINEPLLLPTEGGYVEPRYPIIDPSARGDVTGEIDKGNPDTAVVDGFDFKTKDNIDTDLKMKVKNPSTGFEKDVAVPYLPMPVKWLYVRKDGSMWAMDATGNIGPPEAKSSPEVYEKKNPVVGRTAFWTDDESCKININTASEGVFWDTPSVSSLYESGLVDTGLNLQKTPGGLDLGASQPVRGEFQRYPGHPATTSLSPVLGWLWLNDGTKPDHKYQDKWDPEYQVFKEAIYSMAPFAPTFRDGSNEAGSDKPTDSRKYTSKGGTFNPIRIDSPKPETYNPPIPDLTRPTQHLYATIDELLFHPKRFVLDSPTPPENPEKRFVLQNESASNVSTKLTASALERTRFFLTANSRSPEVNMFGRPRVSMWPIGTNATFAANTFKTPFDQLIAFTSTLKPDTSPLRFYFQRTNYEQEDPKRATKGPCSSEYDYLQIPENQKMFNYLRWLTSRLVPSYNKAYEAKYGVKNRDQTLVCIYDYIRTINVVDTSTPQNAPAGSSAPKFVPFTPQFPVVGYGSPGFHSPDYSAQVTPAKITVGGEELRGMGRFPTITEAALMFNRVDRQKLPLTPVVITKSVQCVLLLEMGSATPGFPVIRETFSTVVREIRPTQIRIPQPRASAADPLAFTVNNASFVINPGDSIANFYTAASHEIGYGRSYRPDLGFINGFYYFPLNNMLETTGTLNAKIFKSGANIINLTTPTPITPMAKYYPYCSMHFDLPNVQYTQPQSTPPVPHPDYLAFEFVGGEYEVKVYTGYNVNDSKNLVQTFTVNFPTDPRKFKFPPDPATGGYPANGAEPHYTKSFLDYEPRTTGLIPDATVPITVSRCDEGARHGQLYPNPPVIPLPPFNVDANSHISRFDVIRGMECVGPETTLQNQGDLRLTALTASVPSTWFRKRNPNYDTDVVPPSTGTWSRQIVSNFQAHGLTFGYGIFPDGLTDTRNPSRIDWEKGLGRFAGSTGTIGYKTNPILPYGLMGVRRGGTTDRQGDFDRGLSKQYDAAGFNKSDEGNVMFDSSVNPPLSQAYRTPYYRGRGVEPPGAAFFTPNRQMSSSVMFGSIPSEVWSRANPTQPGKSWQTLLFRPDRDAHPGQIAGQVPDHLLLDLFHMPVVEPYAISEPFSTAGKININSVIAPFGYANGDSASTGTGFRPYLKRDTAIRALLKSTKVMLVENEEAFSGHQEGGMIDKKVRFDINLGRTIAAMESRIKNPQRGLFRSPSEICEVDLLTDQVGANENLETFWAKYGATGDNHRERPYAHIYPRVTTKSNVYTVYMRCQSIKEKNATSSGRDLAAPGRFIVDGEYRGSTTIERFIDPNDPNLNSYNFLADGSVPRLEPYYRFRIVGSKQFSPR